MSEIRTSDLLRMRQNVAGSTRAPGDHATSPRPQTILLASAEAPQLGAQLSFKSAVGSGEADEVFSENQQRPLRPVELRILECV